MTLMVISLFHQNAEDPPRARIDQEPTIIRHVLLAALTNVLLCASAYGSEAHATATSELVLPPIKVLTDPDRSTVNVVTIPERSRQPLSASDSADYLKTIPGFSAIRSGGANGDAVFRGMFGSRLNILSDGATTLGACPGRMDAPTSYISPESYDNLTIIKGPQSVMYGPGASAGTVMFERDMPHFTEPELHFEGSVGGGSFGRNDQNVDLSAGTAGAYTRVVANHSHEQDYTNGSGSAVASQWDKWSIDTALGATPDDHTRLELSAGAGNGYARYASRAMDGAQFRRETVALRFDRTLVNHVLRRTEAHVYISSADHVMDNYTLRQLDFTSLMPTERASEVRRRTIGGRVAATLRWAEHDQLIIGSDIQSHELDSRSQRGAQSYREKSWVPSAAMFDIGLFAEITRNVDGLRRVVAGGRLDRAGARDNRAPSVRKIPSVHDPIVLRERERTLPSGFLRYEHDVEKIPMTWYAGIGHVQRFPDYWELFSSRGEPAGSINAFTSTQPEKTTQIDVGVQYNGSKLDAWSSAYVGAVQDFILFNYHSSVTGSATQATNVGARIFGAELGGTWRPMDPLEVEATLAYAWGQSTGNGKPLPQIPPLEGRLAVDYIRSKWAVGGLWRLVAPQHRYTRGKGNVVGKDFGPSSGFGIVSLHTHHTIPKMGKISVGVDNLFHKAYSEHLNLAGNSGFGYSANTLLLNPGRTVWARFTSIL